MYDAGITCATYFVCLFLQNELGVNSIFRFAKYNVRQ